MIENNILTLQYYTAGSRRGSLTLDIERAFRVYSQKDFTLLLETVKKSDNAEVVIKDINAYLIGIIDKLKVKRDKTDDMRDEGKKERARINKDIKHYAGLQNILVKRFDLEKIDTDQEATATAKPCETYIFENNICIRKEKAYKITRGGFDFIIYEYNNRYYVRLDGIIPCVIPNKKSKAEAIRDINTVLLRNLKQFDPEKMDYLRQEYKRIVKEYEQPEEVIIEDENTPDIIAEETPAVVETSEEIPAIIEASEKEAPAVIRIDKHRQRPQLNRLFFRKVARRARYDIKRIIKGVAA